MARDRVLVLVLGIVIGMTISIHTVETALNSLDLPQLCNTVPAVSGN